MKVAVIIPAYNAAGHLDQLLAETLKQADIQDIVVINDGSRDTTRYIAESCGVRCLSYAQNRGKGMALKIGFAQALSQDYDAVITMDADGQHPPHFIPWLVEKSNEGFDIVLGSRRSDFRCMSPARYFSNSVTTVVVSLLSGQAIEDSQCGFRLINRKVLESIDLVTSGYQTESELLIKAGRRGFKIGHIPIRAIASDSSHIKHLSDTANFLAMAIKTLWM